MHDIFATALMGLFLFGGGSGTSASSGVTPVEAEPPQHIVKLTGYNAVPEQTNHDPFTTASGAYSNPEVVAARSRDLADKLPYGTVIKIERPALQDPLACGFDIAEAHIGYRVLADTMHVRKKNQVDIMFPTHHSISVGARKVNPAIALGICDEVTITVVGYFDIKDIPKTQKELASRFIAPVFAMR